MILLSLERGRTVKATSKRIASTMREGGKGKERDPDEAISNYGNHIE